MKDGASLKSFHPREGSKIAFEILEHEEKLSRHDIVVILREWNSENWTLGPPQELKLTQETTVKYLASEIQDLFPNIDARNLVIARVIEGQVNSLRQNTQEGNQETKEAEASVPDEETTKSESEQQAETKEEEKKDDKSAERQKHNELNLKETEFYDPSNGIGILDLVDQIVSLRNSFIIAY